jgi:1-acyl-sn-glycerol-3-phosphate acyltransferase
MRKLRAVWRLCRVVLHVVAGLWIIGWRFPRLSGEQQAMHVQVWSISLLSRLSIQLVVKGTPPVSGPMLLVSNHISWLDIGVMHAARHCRFVSKADVAHWPLVGTLARGAGTLFIERESRRDAMRVVHQMADALRAGEVLAVFPEGTTGDGTTLLPFHANLLQAAISADAPIQPVALSFRDGVTGERSFAPCYIGDDTLLGSLWRTLQVSGLIAEVNFGEQQIANGRDRRAWATELRTSIAELRDAP